MCIEGCGGQASPTSTPWNPTLEALMLLVPRKVGMLSAASNRNSHLNSSFPISALWTLGQVILGLFVHIPHCLGVSVGLLELLLSLHTGWLKAGISAPTCGGQQSKIKVSGLVSPLRFWGRVPPATPSFWGLPAALAVPWLMTVSLECLPPSSHGPLSASLLL